MTSRCLLQTLVSPRTADVHLVSLSCNCWSVTLKPPFFPAAQLPWLDCIFLRLHRIVLTRNDPKKWLGLFSSLFSIICLQHVHLCMHKSFWGQGLAGVFQVHLASAWMNYCFVQSLNSEGSMFWQSRTSWAVIRLSICKLLCKPRLKGAKEAPLQGLLVHTNKMKFWMLNN